MSQVNNAFDEIISNNCEIRKMLKYLGIKNPAILMDISSTLRGKSVAHVSTEELENDVSRCKWFKNRNLVHKSFYMGDKDFFSFVGVCLVWELLGNNGDWGSDELDDGTFGDKKDARPSDKNDKNYLNMVKVLSPVVNIVDGVYHFNFDLCRVEMDKLKISGMCYDFLGRFHLIFEDINGIFEKNTGLFRKLTLNDISSIREEDTVVGESSVSCDKSLEGIQDDEFNREFIGVKPSSIFELYLKGEVRGRFWVS